MDSGRDKEQNCNNEHGGQQGRLLHNFLLIPPDLFQSQLSTSQIIWSHKLTLLKVVKFTISPNCPPAEF
jgi:hypothetical protein